MRPRLTITDRIALSPGFATVLTLVGLGECYVRDCDEWWLPLVWLAIGAVIPMIIRTFMLTRSVSTVMAGVFMLLQALLVGTSTAPVASLLLTLVVLLSAVIFFTNYQKPNSTQPLFIPFFLCGLGALYTPAYLLLAVVFFIGCISMRQMSARGVLAVVLALVTAPLLFIPTRIVYFDLGEWASAMIPAYDVAALRLYVAEGLAASVCLVFGGACMLISYGYQAKARSFNGFVYLLTIYAILLCGTNIGGAGFGATLLCLCAAYHLGHFAVTHTRSWLSIVVVSLLAIGCTFILW